MKAEEILENKIRTRDFTGNDFRTWVLEAMEEYAEAYHKAKLAEITDADIEEWAEKIYLHEAFDAVCIDAFIKGAKAVLNGEIKHTEK